jgi:pyridoxal 5'-phosphate synthase pdxT subunit
VGIRIGVLALQGAFAKHCQALKRLEVDPILVKYPAELEKCVGLILPGGESTTMTRQIEAMDLASPLRAFALCFPIFGTCAGMILMAQEGVLNLLDITVVRNGYGRQCDSFQVPLKLPFSPHPLQAFFIRAPRIVHIHSPLVDVLASHAGEPVCVQQGRHLAASFHPELTSDLTLHDYFLQIIRERA